MLFFKILEDDQFISTLNGEISFLISDSLKYQKPKKTDISNEDDFWEDDFNESEIDFRSSSLLKSEIGNETL